MKDYLGFLILKRCQTLITFRPFRSSFTPSHTAKATSAGSIRSAKSTSHFPVFGISRIKTTDQVPSFHSPWPSTFWFAGGCGVMVPNPSAFNSSTGFSPYTQSKTNFFGLYFIILFGSKLHISLYFPLLLVPIKIFFILFILH